MLCLSYFVSQYREGHWGLSNESKEIFMEQLYVCFLLMLQQDRGVLVLLLSS